MFSASKMWIVAEASSAAALAVALAVAVAASPLCYQHELHALEFLVQVVALSDGLRVGFDVDGLFDGDDGNGLLCGGPFKGGDIGGGLLGELHALWFLVQVVARSNGLRVGLDGDGLFDGNNGNGLLCGGPFKGGDIGGGLLGGGGDVGDSLCAELRGVLLQLAGCTPNCIHQRHVLNVLFLDVGEYVVPIRVTEVWRLAEVSSFII